MLEQRYDPETWQAFQQWAQAQQLENGMSLWEWLNGKG